MLATSEISAPMVSELVDSPPPLRRFAAPYATSTAWVTIVQRTPRHPGDAHCTVHRVIFFPALDKALVFLLMPIIADMSHLGAAFGEFALIGNHRKSAPCSPARGFNCRIQGQQISLVGNFADEKLPGRSVPTLTQRYITELDDWIRRSPISASAATTTCFPLSAEWFDCSAASAILLIVLRFPAAELISFEASAKF